MDDTLDNLANLSFSIFNLIDQVIRSFILAFLFFYALMCGVGGRMVVVSKLLYLIKTRCAEMQ